jgi:hypothetical protein
MQKYVCMYVCMCMAAVSTLYFSLFQFPICQERGTWWRGQGLESGAGGGLKARQESRQPHGQRFVFTF